MEKIYRVQMNSKGMPNFATAEEIPQAEWRDADGNFVPLDEDGCTTASAWCSNCGEWLTGSDEHWTSGRFCPNCGRRMRKE